MNHKLQALTLALGSVFILTSSSASNAATEQKIGNPLALAEFIAHETGAVLYYECPLGMALRRSVCIHFSQPVRAVIDELNEIASWSWLAAWARVRADSPFTRRMITIGDRIFVLSIRSGDDLLMHFTPAMIAGRVPAEYFGGSMMAIQEFEPD